MVDPDPVFPASSRASARVRRRRRGLGPGLALLLVVALVAAGLAASRSGLLADAASRLPWASAPTPCPSTEVSIVAAPDAAPVVTKVVAPLQGRTMADGSCLRVDVRGEEPSRTVTTAAGTLTSLPQLWIPDSSLWAGQMDGWPTAVAGSLATSPVVLAGNPATLHRLGWDKQAPRWTQALDPDRRVTAPQMTDDAPSLLALLALARSIGPGVKAEQAVAALVLAAGRNPASDLVAAAALARSRGRTAPVLLTTKQTVTDLNVNPTASDLVAVQPQGLPAVLDYPVLRVGRSAADDPVVDAGADLVVATLTAPAATAAAAAAGFGPPSRALVPTTAAGRRAAEAAAGQVSAFVSQVRLQAVPTRMLLLMDVSLSMGETVRPGLSRAELASLAASGAGKLLPDDSAIGLWRFAGKQPGRRPYTEVTGIEQLGSLDGDRSHRDVVNGALAQLPRQLSTGGTALYDTAAAGLREVRSSYDPRARNALVIFTDGRDDYPPGIGLRRFQQVVKADAQAHPDRPIVVVGIGMGPSADMAALRAMVAPVHGRVYRADSPEVLRTVLFDAVAHRERSPS